MKTHSLEVSGDYACFSRLEDEGQMVSSSHPWAPLLFPCVFS